VSAGSVDQDVTVAEAASVALETATV